MCATLNAHAFAVYDPVLCVHGLFFPWDPDGFRLQDAYSSPEALPQCCFSFFSYYFLVVQLHAVGV